MESAAMRRSSMRRSSLLPLLLLSLAAICLLPAAAQLSFLVPDTCAAPQRFDISSLSCIACPANSAVSAADATRCRCLPGYAGTGVPADAYALACTDCTALGMAANRDRTACMRCATNGTLSLTTRECSCPTGQVLGQSLDQQQMRPLHSIACICSLSSSCSLV